MARPQWAATRLTGSAHRHHMPPTTSNRHHFTRARTSGSASTTASTTGITGPAWESQHGRRGLPRSHHKAAPGTRAGTQHQGMAGSAPTVHWTQNQRPPSRTPISRLPPSPRPLPSPFPDTYHTEITPPAARRARRAVCTRRVLAAERCLPGRDAKERHPSLVAPCLPAPFLGSGGTWHCWQCHSVQHALGGWSGTRTHMRA